MPAVPQPEWLDQAADLCAREGLGLSEALTRLRVSMTSREAADWFRSKLFQTSLRAAKLRFFREVGNSPEWSKATAIGQLLFDAQMLRDAGEFDKAAEVTLKAAKVAGWLNADTNVNVFAGLSGRELEEIRNKIAERASGAGAPATGEPFAN